MKNLTGVWKQTGGDPSDLGTYYIRQVADSAGTDKQNVFWFGKQANNKGEWSNVFFGTILEQPKNYIKGHWADVPPGRAGNNGTLTLQIENNGDRIVEIAHTGHFGGKIWERQS